MDPARTIRKYAAFADMAPGSDEEHAFLAVEDWANGGPPLSHAAGRDLFEQFYAANASGRGEWLVGGRAIDSRRLACPTLSIRSAADRIVPAAAAPRSEEHTSELQSLMRISYAVFCLKKKNTSKIITKYTTNRPSHDTI